MNNVDRKSARITQTDIKNINSTIDSMLDSYERGYNAIPDLTRSKSRRYPEKKCFTPHTLYWLVDYIH